MPRIRIVDLLFGGAIALLCVGEGQIPSPADRTRNHQNSRVTPATGAEKEGAMSADLKDRSIHVAGPFLFRPYPFP